MAIQIVAAFPPRLSRYSQRLIHSEAAIPDRLSAMRDPGDEDGQAAFRAAVRRGARHLRAQETARGKNPYVFPGGRPRQPLSIMAMTMVMRRLKLGDWTVHGMRSAARSWMADNGVEFELAEACLAHAVGNAVVQAYQRSSLLERRRPVMQAWVSFLTGEAEAKVVPLSGRRKRS